MGHVDEASNGVLVRGIVMLLLDVLQMFFVGTVETVVALFHLYACDGLAAADINEQVHIVARRVALQCF